MQTSQQLTLNVNLRDGFRFKSFYVAPQSENAETLGILRNIASFASVASFSEIQQNILWGEAHAGKTHLLQACCAKVTDSHDVISYIPLKEMASFGIEILNGLSFSKLIALDDIDFVLGDKEWEISIFNLINQCRESGQHLLMSSTKNPRKMDCMLPDLASRLIWGGSYRIRALNDEDKPKALQARADQRGFKLTDRVVEYLYRRYPRDIESLMALLDKLDKESLRKKAVITIPFVREVLK
ncbi:MAG TPA: DnaA regulatory inactivator Hda [Leucothrix sp.]|nr:DnaA regulatory inactivator Hda [Leucothrix sp.]HIQ15983.1 DnaA regulatory inactivator Hda [Leucothrix sp.]